MRFVSTAVYAALPVCMLLAGCQTLPSENTTAGLPILDKPAPANTSEKPKQALKTKAIHHAKANIGLPGLNTAWPFPGGAVGNNPGHLVLGGGTHWLSSVSEKRKPLTITTSPIASNGVLFLGDENGTVHALSTANGAAIWKNRANRQQRFAAVVSLAVSGQNIITAHRDGVLRGLRMADGTQIWLTRAKAPIALDLVTQGKNIIALDEKGNVIGVDAEKGKIVWKAKTKPPQTAPGIVDKFLVRFDNNGEVHALSKEVTAPLWQTQTKPGSGALPAVITKNSIFVANKKSITRLRRQNGDVSWAKEIGAIGGLVISGEALFTTTPDRNLISLNANSGDLLWSVPLPAKTPVDRNANWSRPVLAGGRLHLTTDTGYVASFNAEDGSLLRLRSINAPIVSGPIVASGRLYIATRTGMVARF